MIRLFHVSDVHFGAEDVEAIQWFNTVLHAEKPDGVVVTGDLTMRARRSEFARAQKWLATLACPVTVQVGNHDLPYFNPWARFVTPYRRFDRLTGLARNLLALGDVVVVPLKTTARAQVRLNWSKGYVSSRALRETMAQIAAVPAGKQVIVACHHPLVDVGTRSTSQTRGGIAALDALANVGVAAVLTGHVHDPFDLTFETKRGAVRMIGAGTLSERVRASMPSFNEVRLEDGRLETQVRVMGQGD